MRSVSFDNLQSRSLTIQESNIIVSEHREQWPGERLSAMLVVWGDWKRETGHRETIKIVGTDIAILDNTKPYNKGRHREVYFSVLVSCISVSNSFLRHLCVLLYTVYVFYVFLW